MQNASMKDQLAAQFNCVMIEGMDNAGVTFDIAIPTANIKVAELESNLDVMVREMNELEHSFQFLVQSAGERVCELENWGIFLDGKLFHDGYWNRDEATSAMAGLQDEMREHYGDNYGLAALMRMEVALVDVFPRSRWLSKLSHKMRMHMVQIDQTHKILAAVGC